MSLLAEALTYEGDGRKAKKEAVDVGYHYDPYSR